MKKIAFLDRDGVINVDYGYVYLRENFHFMDGLEELMKWLISSNFEIIIVTNQSGIGRGIYSEKQYLELTFWYKKYLASNGISILDIFYCPYYKHSKNSKYSIDSNCRKPKPGMFLKSFEKYEIDLEESFVVGDKFTDIKAGYLAGLKKGFLISKQRKNIQKISMSFGNNFRLEYFEDLRKLHNFLVRKDD